jgi:hypothetical protein
MGETQHRGVDADPELVGITEVEQEARQRGAGVREPRPISEDLSEQRPRVRHGLFPQPGRHPVERVGVGAELAHDRAGEARRESVMACPAEFSVLIDQTAECDDLLGVHRPELLVENSSDPILGSGPGRDELGAELLADGGDDLSGGGHQ